MKWLLVLFCLAGNYLNIKKHWTSFILFAIVDGYYFGHHAVLGEYAEALIFLIYFVCACVGTVCWGMEDRRNLKNPFGKDGK